MAVLCAPRVPAAIVWSAVVATHVTLLLGPPLSLTDVFNYLHYGRMPATYGVNPYAALPLTVPPGPGVPLLQLAPPPVALRPALHAASPRASLRSRCPPPTGRGRACMLAAALGTLVLVAFTARRLGRSPQAAVALVGLNPLVLVYGIGGAHNEPLVLLCSVAAVSLAVVGWQAGTAPWWDVGAGACAVLAAGFKPSAALLAPVVVLACRRRLPALGGAGSAGVLVLAVVGLVYGGHLPATSIQDGLVGPLSVPNVLAALAGHGGMTPHDRTLAHAVLALAAVGATAVVTWRRSWLPGAAGFVMLAAVLTLGWTMPWYVWWVLPFAALARTRALAGACIVLTAWLALGAIPQMPKVIHHFGYFPTRTAAGLANHLYTQRYLQ